MSDIDDPLEEPTAAEVALERHLSLLRGSLPAPPSTMEESIVRRARWQRTVRRPLLVVGHFAETIRDGIRLLVMPPNR